MNKECRVLCYGDSNTWGQLPFEYKRYLESIRWTKVVETISNGSFEMIEEGLCGRCAGDIDRIKTYQNGFGMFFPTLLSQFPFDFVLIFLGTNDLKAEYKQSPEDVVVNLLKYEEVLHKTFPDIPLIYIIPPTFTIADTNFDGINKKFTEISDILTKHKKNIINLKQIVVDSEDGLHFTPENHRDVAEVVNLNTRRFI